MFNDTQATRPALPPRPSGMGSAPALPAKSSTDPALPGLQYCVYETEDGKVVIYDDGYPDAYIRSDVTVEATR